MENYIKVVCKCYDKSFDEFIQKYNSNIKTDFLIIDSIIDYKIKNNKDIIYKEDLPKILGLSQEMFMEYVMEDAKYHNVDINNLIYEKYYGYIKFYYLYTLLDNEPVDIKIALKD